MYTTQFFSGTTPVDATLTDADRALGAPFSPVPRSFLKVDPRLDVCQSLCNAPEVEKTLALRSDFRFGNYPDPHILDILRAFRLISGKKTYLEIGIFDRGNLAYASSLLANDAHLIGVDIQEDQVRDGLLRQHLRGQQKYDCVVGSSRQRETVDKVRELLNGARVDAIFIDGDHTAYGVMSDYALYEEFIADDGIILFHDSVWEGSPSYKGVCDALSEIDKLDPVYLVDGTNAVRRFSRPMWRDEFWGVVGVIFASDQHWRQARP